MRAAVLWTSVVLAATTGANERAAGYLARVMDQFHEAHDVYTTADAAGNHFTGRARMSNYDSSGRGDDAQRAVPAMDESWAHRPFTAPTCIRASFRPELRDGQFNWGAWYFMDDVQRDGRWRTNWGNYPWGGTDLTGATRLTFRARGESGSERVEFFAFGVGWNPDDLEEHGRALAQTDPETGKLFAHPDSSRKVATTAVLTTDWERYSIDLRGLDLSYVLGGFGWAANAVSNLPKPEIVFYVDDVRYELGPAAKRRRLEQPRFLVSYDTGIGTDFDRVMRNVAYTYDNALALLAFLAAGDVRRAGLIAEAFVTAQERDRFLPPDERRRRMYEGAIRNAYQGGDLTTPSGAVPHTMRMPGWSHRAESTPSIAASDIASPTRLARQLLQSDSAAAAAVRERVAPGLLETLARGPSCRAVAEPNRRQLLAAELNRTGAGAALAAAFPREIRRTPSGLLEDSYTASLDAGNTAWAMLALLAYHEFTARGGDSRHLAAATRMGEWVARNCDGGDGVGYTGGYNGFEPEPERACYKSTEHNIDLYAAFERLYLLTGNELWHRRAIRALTFVESMWDEERGMFWTGTTPEGQVNREVIPLDIQPWAVLSLGDELAEERQARALDYAERHMRLPDGYDYSRRACADDVCSDREGVWYEGTAQMAAAYRARGDVAKANEILQLLRAAQEPSGAMTASNQPNGLVTGFRHNDECIRYFQRPHVGATAWLILAERGANPYWIRPAP